MTSGGVAAPALAQQRLSPPKSVLPEFGTRVKDINPNDRYILTSERLAEIRKDKMYPFFDSDDQGGKGDLVTELNYNSVKVQKQLNYRLPYFGFAFNYTWVFILSQFKKKSKFIIFVLKCGPRANRLLPGRRHVRPAGHEFFSKLNNNFFFSQLKKKSKSKLNIFVLECGPRANRLLPAVGMSGPRAINLFLN